MDAQTLEAASWSLRFNSSAAIASSPLMPALQHVFESLTKMRQSHVPPLCVDSCGQMLPMADLSWRLRSTRSKETLLQPLDTWRDHCRVRSTLRPLRRAQNRTAWLIMHHHRFWRGRYNEQGEQQPSGSEGYDEYELLVLRLARPLAAEALQLTSPSVAAESPSLDRLLLTSARLACSTSPIYSSKAREVMSARGAGDESSGGESAAAPPRADVLVVGGGIVGLTTAIAARLAGAPVTLWERRALEARTRLHMVDLHELYDVEEGRSGALVLAEALGLFQIGLTGFWEPLWHRRGPHGKLVAAFYAEDGFDELRWADVDFHREVHRDDHHWIVNLQIATLERVCPPRHRRQRLRASPLPRHRSCPGTALAPAPPPLPQHRPCPGIALAPPYPHPHPLASANAYASVSPRA